MTCDCTRRTGCGEWDQEHRSQEHRHLGACRRPATTRISVDGGRATRYWCTYCAEYRLNELTDSYADEEITVEKIS